MEFIKDIFTYVIIIAIIILIRIYVLTTAEVVGPSMDPNLHNREILLVDQISHKKYLQYKRFDIIVIEYSNPRFIIKRIVGLPGEKIEFIHNQLYINDKIINQVFATEGKTEDFSLQDLKYNIIPAEMYFVLGDNRENSKDSREIGLISKNKIVGRPLLVIWPLKEISLVK